MRRHPPLVRRGYWARVAATRALATRFGDAAREGRFNVVNLGCGYDTIGLWILDAHPRARVVEVDLEAVRAARLERLRAARVEQDAASYEVVACDVRERGAIERALDGLSVPFDWALPTLVIAECVLAYLPSGTSDEVVRFFGERCSSGAFVSYDPIEPDDAFGKQMMRNVESRGCAFAGIRDAANVSGARARFERNGWRRARAYDMNEVYARLDPVERARIERIDRFDEFEEWRLILAHYCVSFGVNGDESLANFDLC